MKIEYERKTDKRRWRLEIDGWVDRALIAALIFGASPGLGIEISKLTAALLGQ